MTNPSSSNLNSLELTRCLNTSNPGKSKEFKCFFQAHGIQLKITTIDLPEIIADPLSVVVHKASIINNGQGDIIVEDTSLEIVGEKVGIHIKKMLSHLDQLVGKDAIWTVLLAFRHKDWVYVSKGEVKGKIVETRGISGFGFDPYFVPQGSNKTLAEEKSNKFSARALAVRALVENNFIAIQPPIVDWKGEWQN